MTLKTETTIRCIFLNFWVIQFVENKKNEISDEIQFSCNTQNNAMKELVMSSTSETRTAS